MGFKHNLTDSFLFIYHQGTDTTYLLLYIGALNYFLGISTTCSLQGLFLFQHKYTSEILERAHMLQCNPACTPAEATHKLDATDPQSLIPRFTAAWLGNFSITFTRPDIAFAVQHIFLFMQDPCKPHMHALKHILCYLRRTLDHGLQLYVSSTSDLCVYSDADWGDV